VAEGFLFSVGENINVDSMSLIPMERIFCETDEGEMSIRDVYLQASQALNIEVEKFAAIVRENVQRVFPALHPPEPFYQDESEVAD
jgi:TatD DNase family protein